MPLKDLKSLAPVALIILILVLGALWRGLEHKAYTRWAGFYDWPAERIIYNINCSMDGVDPMWYYPQFHPIDEVTDMLQEWFGLGRYAHGYTRPAAVGSNTWFSRQRAPFAEQNVTHTSQPAQLPSRYPPGRSTSP